MDLIQDGERNHGSTESKVMAVLDNIQSDLQSPEAGTHQFSKPFASLDSATKHLPHLPLEMLAEIFMHCLDRSELTGHTEIRIPGRYLLPTPWILSQVCSRWRQIVLMEPQLWNSIVFSGNVDHFPMLEQAFERCGRSSIRFKFDAYDTDPLGDIILPHSNQFRELSLYLEPDIFDAFLCLPPGLFDALECVDLSYNYAIEIPSEEARVFRGAPRLHRVTIQNLQVELPPFPRFPLPLGLPWARLTHINFGIIRIPLTVTHELMTLCSNLHEFRLCLYGYSNITDPFDAKEYSTGTILLPRLRELELSVRGRKWGLTVDLYCRYLRPLRLPALQKFKFVFPGCAEQPTSTFAAMIADLSPPSLCSELSYLGPWFGFFPVETIAPLTFVTCIKIPCCSLPRSSMELIFQGKIFPKLMSLDVRIDTADMEAFITMLTTQWSTKSQPPHTVARIRSARICINNASTAALSRFTQEIDQLRDQFDLDIRLSGQ